MPHVQPIEENEASPEVKEVFDDIKKLRQVEEVNNFWKYLANHPPTLKRTWESLKEVMQPGACLLYTSPSPRDKRQSRMPSSA